MLNVQLFRNEKPEIYHVYEKIWFIEVRDTEILTQNTNQVIKELNEYTGEILDDSELIATFAAFNKTEDNIVDNGREKIINLNEKIRAYSQIFKSISEKIVTLYELIQNLRRMNPKYQYSVILFQQIIK
jgi:hypothetical protein